MFDLCRHPRALRALALLYRFQSGRARRRADAVKFRAIRAAFYRQVWEDAAREYGAEFEILDGDLCEIRLGGFRARFQQNDTPLDDWVTLCVAGNKALTSRLLSRHGLRTPRHVRFTLETIGEAAAFLDQLRQPCVVKPAAGTGGGTGVTTGVRTRRHLAHAAAAARVYGDDLLIEEQIAGHFYRLLYLDGELIDAVARRPPRVIADGRATVRTLIERANAARLARGAEMSQALLGIDLDTRRTLAEQGLTLSSVPPAGREVVLKQVINDNTALDNQSAIDCLCPEIIAEGAQAAQVLGVKWAGVDVITPDPTVPLAAAGGAIIEVNTAPGHYWHYHQTDGGCPVAQRILEYLFAQHSADDAATRMRHDACTASPCFARDSG